MSTAGAAQSRGAAHIVGKERGQEGASGEERRRREGGGVQGEGGQSFQSMSGLLWSLGSALAQGEIASKRSPDHKGLREDGRKLKDAPCRVPI